MGLNKITGALNDLSRSAKGNAWGNFINGLQLHKLNQISDKLGQMASGPVTGITTSLEAQAIATDKAVRKSMMGMKMSAKALRKWSGRAHSLAVGLNMDGGTIGEAASQMVAWHGEKFEKELGLTLANVAKIQDTLGIQAKDLSAAAHALRKQFNLTGKESIQVLDRVFAYGRERGVGDDMVKAATAGMAAFTLKLQNLGVTSKEAVLATTDSVALLATAIADSTGQDGATAWANAMQVFDKLAQGQDAWRQAFAGLGGDAGAFETELIQMFGTVDAATLWRTSKENPADFVRRLSEEMGNLVEGDPRRKRFEKFGEALGFNIAGAGKALEALRKEGVGLPAWMNKASGALKKAADAAHRTGRTIDESLDLIRQGFEVKLRGMLRQDGVIRDFMRRQRKAYRTLGDTLRNLSKRGGPVGAFTDSLIRLKVLGLQGLFMGSNSPFAAVSDAMLDIAAQSIPTMTALGALGLRFSHLAAPIKLVTGPLGLLNGLLLGLPKAALGLMKVPLMLGAAIVGLGWLYDAGEKGDLLKKVSQFFSRDLPRTLLNAWGDVAPNVGKGLRERLMNAWLEGRFWEEIGVMIAGGLRVAWNFAVENFSKGVDALASFADALLDIISDAMDALAKVDMKGLANKFADAIDELFEPPQGGLIEKLSVTFDKVVRTSIDVLFDLNEVFWDRLESWWDKLPGSTYDKLKVVGERMGKVLVVAMLLSGGVRALVFKSIAKLTGAAALAAGAAARAVPGVIGAGRNAVNTAANAAPGAVGGLMEWNRNMGERLGVGRTGGAPVMSTMRDHYRNARASRTEMFWGPHGPDTRTHRGQGRVRAGLGAARAGAGAFLAGRGRAVMRGGAMGAGMALIPIAAKMAAGEEITVKDSGRAVGTALGTAIGALGGPIGMMLGGAVGSAVGEWLAEPVDNWLGGLATGDSNYSGKQGPNLALIQMRKEEEEERQRGVARYNKIVGSLDKTIANFGMSTQETLKTHRDNERAIRDTIRAHTRLNERLDRQVIRHGDLARVQSELHKATRGVRRGMDLTADQQTALQPALEGLRASGKLTDQQWRDFTARGYLKLTGTALWRFRRATRAARNAVEAYKNMQERMQAESAKSEARVAGLRAKLQEMTDAYSDAVTDFREKQKELQTIGKVVKGALSPEGAAQGGQGGTEFERKVGGWHGAGHHVSHYRAKVDEELRLAWGRGGESGRRAKELVDLLKTHVGPALLSEMTGPNRAAVLKGLDGPAIERLGKVLDSLALQDKVLTTAAGDAMTALQKMFTAEGAVMPDRIAALFDDASKPIGQSATDFYEQITGQLETEVKAGSEELATLRSQRDAARTAMQTANKAVQDEMLSGAKTREKIVTQYERDKIVRDQMQRLIGAGAKSRNATMIKLEEALRGGVSGSELATVTALFSNEWMRLTKQHGAPAPAPPTKPADWDSVKADGSPVWTQARRDKYNADNGTQFHRGGIIMGKQYLTDAASGKMWATMAERGPEAIVPIRPAAAAPSGMASASANAQDVREYFLMLASVLKEQGNATRHEIRRGKSVTVNVKGTRGRDQLTAIALGGV